MLFPFAEYWWFYLGFTVFVIALLAIDLGIFNRKAHEIHFREAAGWTVFWILLALAFGWGFYTYAAWHFPRDVRLMALPNFDPSAAASQAGLEYLTGYVVEKALAADNIFVFIVIFNYFAIPAKYLHRVLFYGIFGALVFRSVFIALGAFLIQYAIVVILFGVFLILTGFKILFSSDKPVSPETNPLLRFLQKVLPVTSHLEGAHFFVRENSRLIATPLFIALCAVEFADIIFAVDSLPAIFGVTKEPLIVFTSNIFAILGLRAMFFLLAGAVHKFHLIKYGLGAVLIFVGLKMVWLNHVFGGHFPIIWSLCIISVLIGASIVASLLIPNHKESS